jgi:hypothetical protein
MDETSRLTPLVQPGLIKDPLTEIAREGARQMLAQALRREVDDFLALHADERLEDGRARVVGHGTGPDRAIKTGIGPISVARPKVRDRAAGGATSDRIRFSSAILPKWARRTRAIVSTTSIPIRPPCKHESHREPHRQRGPYWTPITPLTGSLFHAYPHLGRVDGFNQHQPARKTYDG